jgi:hypothetical protein
LHPFHFNGGTARAHRRNRGGYSPARAANSARCGCTCLVPVSYLPCGSRSTWEVRDRYETCTP